MSEISVQVHFIDGTTETFTGTIMATQSYLKITEKLEKRTTLALVEEDTNSVSIPFTSIKYWKTLR